MSERPCGFALVLTISLMVLLSVVAVGLLGLSTISVRQGKAGADQAEAMANARLSVLMAIGQLQAQMGADERISMVADQLPGSTPETTGASASRRRWTGVYDAWLATQKDRPTPLFRTWLVSGDPVSLAARDAAKGSGALGTPPTGRPQEVSLVGAWASGGQTGQEVKAPLLAVQGSGGLAWWSGDENVKALAVERGVALDDTLNFVRSRMSAAPRRGFEIAETLTGEKPFENVKQSDERMPKVLDWPQAELLATNRQSVRGLFHDLSAVSRGMMTNVTAGGFRKDFSLYLERSAPLNTAPKGVYYSVNGDYGINEEEIWSYYHLYDNKTYGLQWGTMPQYTTGGKAGSNTPYFQTPGLQTIADDDFFYFKHPVITSFQQVLSLWAQVVPGSNPVRYELRLVMDPILTYWNPWDVPVVMHPDGNAIKYWQLPYTLRLTIGAKMIEVPILNLINPSDRNVISVRPGNAQQIVLRPGEVMMVSQAAGEKVPRPYSHTQPDRLRIICQAGFHYGGGLAYLIKDAGGATVYLSDTERVDSFELVPNNYTSGGPPLGGHSNYFSVTHHEWYVGEDRGTPAVSYGFGGMAIDWGWGDKRLIPDSGGNLTLRDLSTIKATKPLANRFVATSYPQVMKGVTAAQSRPLSGQQLVAAKAPMMLFSFNLKTETSSDNPSRYLARFNRNALFNDFYNLTQQVLDMSPYEVQVEALNSWKSPSLELTPGPAYLGGGHTALSGVSRIITHSVPREPVISLAALQHSMANGFAWRKRPYGYAANDSREPLLPQISHAIGNSMACSLLAPEATEGMLAGVRPMADHSYLANRALFDDWFFSGMAPQTAGSFTTKRTQTQVAKDFLGGTTPLPNVNYRARLNGQTVDKVLNLLVRSSGPTTDGHIRVASFLAVDGLFNVNSTSVEAWRTLLAGLRKQALAVQGSDGGDKRRDPTEATVVSGLQTPVEAQIESSNLDDMADPTQWVGFRTLTDDEIEELAKAIVVEVRRRGPFLSLADFVNRRVGKDKDLARCGAVQAALDSPKVKINEEFIRGTRALAVGGGRAFAFPEAESGAAAYGAPGYVKQADILTPIAPVLSARSDTFRIRGYGEKTAANGEVLARAWCEAVVERIPDYVDSTDRDYERATELTATNRKFGRQFRMIAFRWLAPNEV